MTCDRWRLFVAAACLLAAGCGDVEVRGRLVSVNGPGFAGYDLWFGKQGLLQDTTYDRTSIGADGKFSVMVPGEAVSAGLVTFVLSSAKGALHFQGHLAGADGDAPGLVNLGDISLWDPALGLEVGDASVGLHWTPAPPGLPGNTELHVSDMEMDPVTGSVSVPSWLLEDRGGNAWMYWSAERVPSGLDSLGGGDYAQLPIFAASAAADAPCYGYRLDSDGYRREGVIDPCVLTDRDKDTWFDLDNVNADDGQTRGVAVDLGDDLPLSRIVVRAQDPSPAAHVLIADGQGASRLVGELSAATTGFVFEPPIVARRVLVESDQAGVIVDIAAFIADDDH
ncbi:MAG: hypothetical protein WB239_10310 [Acidimicrobiia bacterium]